MALIRILRTARQTLTHVFSVDEVATDLTGDCTVTLKRLDGTTVATATAGHPSLGTYTYAVPEQANLDSLTLDWAGTLAGAAVSVRDFVEIVGGFIFSLSEGRAAHRNLAVGAVGSPSAATLAQKRTAVEQECERICRQAWVPRFARFLLDGSGTSELVVPDMHLRTARAASTADRAGATFTALTSTELAAISAQDSGVLIRTDGGIWPDGHSNVIVEYEHGHDYPPEEIKDAAILRLRSKVGQNTSTIPDRAVSFTIAEGGTYRIATPGKRSTGIPDVDAAYLGNSHERIWIA